MNFEDLNEKELSNARASVFRPALAANKKSPGQNSIWQMLATRPPGIQLKQAAGQSPGASSAAAGKQFDSSESKEKIFKGVSAAISPQLDQAWADATRTWHEWGGFIIKQRESGEIKVDKYRKGQKGMMVRLFHYRAPKGYDLIGEFHTHQYDKKEVKKWQKDVPSFTGEDDGIDTQDIIGASDYFSQDYVVLVVSGKTLFGAVVSAPDLAEKFASQPKYGAAAIDEADWRTLWDFKEGKTTGSYSEKTWENLKQVTETYKKKMGKETGIEFFRETR